MHNQKVILVKILKINVGAKAPPSLKGTYIDAARMPTAVMNFSKKLGVFTLLLISPFLVVLLVLLSGVVGGANNAANIIIVKIKAELVKLSWRQSIEYIGPPAVASLLYFAAKAAAIQGILSVPSARPVEGTCRCFRSIKLSLF